ncbi:unnamed protein product [Paramecium octaurelia]|uniref:USP domain-containing protein n=1 Tax=Paramecium octaurelia TaxID=43137 RepID=A0A8S1S1K5_PAROT|nr:unnamed protein product [Paramecium octaurelia]
MYHLTAVLKHDGRASFGHYYSYIFYKNDYKLGGSLIIPQLQRLRIPKFCNQAKLLSRRSIEDQEQLLQNLRFFQILKFWIQLLQIFRKWTSIMGGIKKKNQFLLKNCSIRRIHQILGRN